MLAERRLVFSLHDLQKGKTIVFFKNNATPYKGTTGLLFSTIYSTKFDLYQIFRMY